MPPNKRGRYGTARHTWPGDGAYTGQPCLVEACEHVALPECPVALCAKHGREVYEFGAALVERRLPEVFADAQAVVAAGRPDPPPVLPSRGCLPGWVYFVQFGERVKIGYSAHPYRRIADHPHDRVLGLIPGSYAVEKELHRRFKSSRIVGEWFHATPDLLVEIGRLTSGAA